MINNKTYFYIIFLLLIYSSGYSLSTSLMLDEVSRFCYSFKGGYTWSQPVIDYPYIYCPDSFGFQVCQWDSTQNTIQRITNIGLNGSASEMVQWNNSLFIVVRYDRYTNIQSGNPKLYKVDISNPSEPSIQDSILTSSMSYDLKHLCIVNNTLVATKVENDIYHGLVCIDPASMEIIQTYDQYTHFERLYNDNIITRLNTGGLFQIFSISSNHQLSLLDSVNLPYPAEIFPIFITVNSAIVITHTDESAIIWNASSLSVWQQLSVINDAISSPGVICSGYLVFSSNGSGATRFHFYDISNPVHPLEGNDSEYPSGLHYIPSIYNMLSVGSYIFHYASINGYVCLKEFEQNMNLSFQTYEYNTHPSAARKFGSYVLQPVYFGGVACFDVSDPEFPHYAFSLFANFSIVIDINGNLMSAIMGANDSDQNYIKVFNISDIQNPIEIYASTNTQFIQIAFNRSEPSAFYIVDNWDCTIKKYCYVDGVAIIQFSYPIPLPMDTPVFAHDVLYMVNKATGSIKNLYSFEGFAVNDPQPPTVLYDFVHNYGWLYDAGEYVFIKNLEEDSPYCMFYNENSYFQVENSMYGFGFRNYVCVSKESGVRFYDISESPTGIITASFFLPEYSESGYIEWDDQYLYLFSVDNIAIYTYTLTSNVDQTTSMKRITLSNYPNPFNPSTTIRLSIPNASHVVLSIYNLKGQKVLQLMDVYMQEGIHNVVWDGRDKNGKTVSSGLYLSRLEVGRKVIYEKMVLLK